MVRNQQRHDRPPEQDQDQDQDNDHGPDRSPPPLPCGPVERARTPIRVHRHRQSDHARLNRFLRDGDAYETDADRLRPL